MDKKARLVFSDCAMYSIIDGPLAIYEGKVYEGAYGYIFKANESYALVKCSPEPKIVKDYSVWLKEKDDLLAVKLLIEYQAQVLVNKEQIVENAKNQLKMLIRYKMDMKKGEH